MSMLEEAAELGALVPGPWIQGRDRLAEAELRHKVNGWFMLESATWGSFLSLQGHGLQWTLFVNFTRPKERKHPRGKEISPTSEILQHGWSRRPGGRDGASAHLGFQICVLDQQPALCKSAQLCFLICKMGMHTTPSPEWLRTL